VHCINARAVTRTRCNMAACRAVLAQANGGRTSLLEPFANIVAGYSERWWRMNAFFSVVARTATTLLPSFSARAAAQHAPALRAAALSLGVWRLLTAFTLPCRNWRLERRAFTHALRAPAAHRAPSFVGTCHHFTPHTHHYLRTLLSLSVSRSVLTIRIWFIVLWTIFVNIWAVRRQCCWRVCCACYSAPAVLSPPIITLLVLVRSSVATSMLRDIYSVGVGTALPR